MTRELGGVRIAIDRGGTFCDVWAFIPSHLFTPPIDPDLLGSANIIPSAQGVQVTFKLLSVDPANYEDAPSEGIRRLLQIAQNTPVAKDGRYNTSIIESVRMGTTVATNALLERKGMRFGLVLTKGFADLIEIGDQTRPDLFDLSISRKAKVLYESEDVIEADERVTLEGWSLEQGGPSAEELVQAGGGKVVMGDSGDAVRILKPLDCDALKVQLQKLYDRGIRSLAVCLVHSYTFPEHERQVADIASAIGFTQVSLSSHLSPAIKALPRGNSAVIDAYLSPILRAYVEGFNSHFKGGSAGRRTEFMKSDGGLVTADKFSGLRAILSGPAGGFVGCAMTAYSPSVKRPVVGLDVGGTSSDVCRFAGDFELTFESEIAGVKIACPQLSIETVAAGGGSKLTFKNGMFIVGPESVGAHPGPACYRKGGDLAITDANLLLGRIIPSQFPSIFGPNADQPLDVNASRMKFERLTAEINAATSRDRPFSIHEVAAGFIRVANEGMSRPMRNVTEQKGYAMATHDLCCFGGAGGQHACAIAADLGIATVIIPRFSSILSAYGIACSSLTAEASAPISAEVPDSLASSLTATSIAGRVEQLSATVRQHLQDQGVQEEDIELSITVSMHYDGSDTTLQIPLSEKLKTDFIAAHLRETSFSSTRPVRVSNVRVRGVGRTSKNAMLDYAPELDSARKAIRVFDVAQSMSRAYFEVDGKVQEMHTPVFELKSIPSGSTIRGPAVVVDSTQTIVVEPRATAYCLSEHVIIDVPRPTSAPVLAPHPIDTQVDPITLAVFANRFMSIAEQMGHTLQRTSVSVSIKERLDFSCSIHSTNGALVANAPHIPVHLGSMQYCVQSQHRHWLGRLKRGDVLLSNHPQWGGTHLPDLTVITPVFAPGTDDILYYLASRGHHTDIGGTGVTSMNPISKELWEEGVSIESFKLVSEGKFDEEGVKELFESVAKYPGCFATRRLDHNITDLQAAISANVRGTKLVEKLFQEFGAATVLFYMKEIQRVAQETIRQFLRETYTRFEGKPLRAHDFMDDGTRIELEVRIDPKTGSAEFDWTGTGPQTYGNMNCPISLSYAAIIYTLRSMISPEIPIPLNQGVLDPITNIVPPNSFLNPSAAVAISGSTIASQRLVDVILQAFEAAACSQGCANSVGFGSGGGRDANGQPIPGFTFGESFGGGAGAGPGWHGASATCVHSTNTRQTDVEMVEQRTPLLMIESSIRRGSGGRGKYNGGDGLTKIYQVRKDVNFSIVSQRRVFAPRGMKGGMDGSRGRNLVIKQLPDGSRQEIALASNGITTLAAGDIVRIDTPGGGGWGIGGA